MALIIETIFVLVVLLFSIILHEIAHGSCAFYLGDPTAKEAGRLTLNPFKHLDPLGSVILPLFLLFLTRGQGPIVGWAKPVPINPYNFRDQKWGSLKVALSGPISNFLIGIIFALFVRFLPLSSSFLIFFSIISIYNFAWGIFNLIPIPPLDGSHILFSLLGERGREIRMIFYQYWILLLVIFLMIGLDWVFKLAEMLYILLSGQLGL